MPETPWSAIYAVDEAIQDILHAGSSESGDGSSTTRTITTTSDANEWGDVRRQRKWMTVKKIGLMTNLAHLQQELVTGANTKSLGPSLYALSAREVMLAQRVASLVVSEIWHMAPSQGYAQRAAYATVEEQWTMRGKTGADAETFPHYGSLPSLLHSVSW